MEHQLLRNAAVEVTPVFSYSGSGSSRKQHTSAKVLIDGKYEHTFPHTSRIAKHLEVMPADQLASKMSGGTYFVVDDHLIDFRYGDYNGFVHDQKSIDQMVKTLGFIDFVQESQATGRGRQRTARGPLYRPIQAEVEGSVILLGKRWTDTQISVPLYKEGGEFKSELMFIWSPFVKTINASLNLVRLICTNGMVATTSFLNARIPVLNRWEEHLDIASRQISRRVEDTVSQRLITMGQSRASIGDIMLLEQHAANRLHSGQNSTADGSTYGRLLNVIQVLSPEQHLKDVYQPAVFADKRIADQLPSHLTQFDAYNIATELSSHSVETGKSTNNALDRFASDLMFGKPSNLTEQSARFSGVKQSAFSDATRAFFGDISITDVEPTIIH